MIIAQFNYKLSRLLFGSAAVTKQVFILRKQTNGAENIYLVKHIRLDFTLVRFVLNENKIEFPKCGLAYYY